MTIIIIIIIFPVIGGTLYCDVCQLAGFDIRVMDDWTIDSVMLLKQKKKKENIALQFNNNNCIYQKPAPIFTPSQERHLIF